jgi:gamma-glutamylcyclotransferase (GGCT)/AIG2-like uncharacterized protein YtfP
LRLVEIGDRIVFYGSLRPRYGTQRHLGIESMVEYIGPARWRGALHDLGPYPAFLHGEHQVVGDLYRVTDDRIAAVLDPFEGYDPSDLAGSHYLRERIELLDPIDEAWIYRYLGAPPPGTLVEHGDWQAHLDATNRDGTLGPTAGP